MTLPTSIIARPRVDLPHHRIHEGSFTTLTAVATGITVLNPKYYLILTPGVLPGNILIIAHIRCVVRINPGATFEIFEDAIVSNNGIGIIPRSNNRNSPTLDTPGFSFEDPTVVSEGNRVFIERIGTTTEGGIGGPNFRDEDELMLKIGSKYLFKISPLVDGVAVSFKVNNYSNRQTPIVPPPP